MGCYSRGRLWRAYILWEVNGGREMAQKINLCDSVLVDDNKAKPHSMWQCKSSTGLKDWVAKAHLRPAAAERYSRYHSQRVCAMKRESERKEQESSRTPAKQDVCVAYRNQKKDWGSPGSIYPSLISSGSLWKKQHCTLLALVLQKTVKAGTHDKDQEVSFLCKPS